MVDINQYGPMSGRQILEDNKIVNAADAIRRQQYFNPMEIAINRERNYSALTNNMFTYATYSSIETVAALLKDNTETTLLMSAATTLTLISTSTADVTNGTGAGSIAIIGLNANEEQEEETVALNGRNAVTTTTSFCRLNRALALSAGGTSAPTGTIYIGEGAIVGGKPSIIYGVIMPGIGTMRQLRMSTPVNYEALIAQIITTVGNGKDVTFTVRAKFPGTAWITLATFDNYQSGVYFTLPIPQGVGELADIEFFAEADIGGVRGSAYLIVTLVHKSLITQTFDIGI